MTVLFLGKRFYTNRDALLERFGRIYHLPWHWANAGTPTQLWLLDYYHNRTRVQVDGQLKVVSTPVRKPSFLLRWIYQQLGGFRRRRPSVVVASGDAYIGMVAWLLARTLGARFVFDIYDKYTKFEGYRCILGFDSFEFLLARADVCLFASRSLMTELAWPDRDLLVPNGVDTEHFQPLSVSDVRRQLGLPERVGFVGYFGSMEPDRGVADLIDAIQILRRQGEHVELLLGGRAHDGINLSAPGVRYVGNVKFSEMPLYLNACDALAIPYRLGAFMDAGSSTKIAEAIACAKPLVATRTPNFLCNYPEQAKRLEDRLADPMNPDDLAQIIRKQLKGPICVTMPDNMTWREIADNVLRRAISVSMRHG